MALVMKRKVSQKVTEPEEEDAKISAEQEPKKKLLKTIREEVTLPTEFSEPLTEFLLSTMLIYGEKKIGKTSLAAQFPDAFVIFTEPGGKWLKLKSRYVETWTQFKQYIKILKTDKTFKTVVIDIVDNLYDRCFEHVCRLSGCTHPNQMNDFGDTWKAIEKEFADVMDDLLNMKGVVFISHASSKQQESRSGLAIERIVPTMPKGCAKYLAGPVDTVGFYGYDGYDRILQIRGCEYTDAGSRLENNFLTTDGTPVHSIYMGESAKEGYDNLIAAFNNELEDPGFSADYVPRIGTKNVVRKSKKNS